MNELRSAASKASHTAGVLVFGNVLATLADIVVPLLVVRLLGKADVATLTALLLVYNTVALIASTGFPQAIMYHLPGRPLPERRAVAHKIAGAMFMLGLGAAALLVGVGVFGSAVLDAVSGLDSDEVVELGPLMIIALLPLGDLPGRILPNLLVAEDRPRSAAAYGVFRSLGLSLCTLLPIALGGSVWTVAQCLVGMGVAQGLWVLATLRSLYRTAPVAPSPVSLGTMLRFGLPLGLTDIVAMLNNSFDRFLIMLTFADVVFAEYQAGAWQIPIITRVPYMVGTAMALSWWRCSATATPATPSRCGVRPSRRSRCWWSPSRWCSSWPRRRSSRSCSPPSTRRRPPCCVGTRSSPWAGSLRSAA
ncbi:MAG: oligosaccharide flippase family protein [Deltaproteobacteria bacterium]|nr:oligosaccharide flippase family protein [Deltaproteobacteria bacterium]